VVGEEVESGLLTMNLETDDEMAMLGHVRLVCVRRASSRGMLRIRNAFCESERTVSSWSTDFVNSDICLSL
jgi:hypothetical protein